MHIELDLKKTVDLGRIGDPALLNLPAEISSQDEDRPQETKLRFIGAPHQRNEK